MLRLKCVLYAQNIGEFWQTPTNHLSGNGCKICFKGKSSKELKLMDILYDKYKNEEIIYQCKLNWLKNQSFDFYFPKYKLAIEYQGEQHFMPIPFFGGNKTFKENRERDIKKYILSVENNCKLLYFSFIEVDIKDFPYEVIFNVEKLLEKIDNIIYETNLY